MVLAGALIWGMTRNRMRNRANDPVTEAATAQQYDHPEDREQITRDAQRHVRPN